MECAFTKAFKVDPVTVELTYYNPTHPTMRGFITRIAAFENQFDELVLLNGNWILKGLTKALEGMGVLDANITYKMTTVNDDEIPRKLRTFLPAELIPAEFGGKRTKTLSWPPDY